MNDGVNACPVCGRDAIRRATADDVRDIECPQCGKYDITGSVEWCEKPPDVRRRLSGWIRDQNRLGIVPRIRSDTLLHVASVPLPNVGERAERLLLEALRGQERLNASINLDDPRFIAATYSWDQDEVLALYSLLRERDWMGITQAPEAEVTVKGYMAADELTAQRGQSEEVFVAMSFSPAMTSAYERGLQIGIERGGYVPIRVDRTEHVNRIDDEIVARIRRSAFVVADFTEQKSGVYFEAGFALGLNLPVIWTCRAGDMKDLHFDVRQYNCIDWKDEADLAERLQLRIEAVVGLGPRAG